jgi:hypothetical protein
MDAFYPALRLVVGALFAVIGVSFIYKSYQAGYHGKVKFWTGLEHFGMLFVPITWMSPYVIHLPSSEKSLIVERRSLFHHLLYGPFFLLSALICITSGTDLMGLPGSKIMNTVLTFGRQTMPQYDPVTGITREVPIPPAIVYSPPIGDGWIGSYKFPLIKKARYTILRTLTMKIKTNKDQSLNQWERSGAVDVTDFDKSGNFGEQDDGLPF